MSVSALLTAAGVIAALWYYSELYLHRSTDPLGGLVYFVTGPLAIICGICGWGNPNGTHSGGHDHQANDEPRGMNAALTSTACWIRCPKDSPATMSESHQTLMPAAFRNATRRSA